MMLLDAPCLGQVVSTLSARGREMVSWRCWRRIDMDRLDLLRNAEGKQQSELIQHDETMITPHLDTF